MDDRNFDLQSALDWIAAVEVSGKSWRDELVYPKLKELISKAPVQSVLDIGCGQGICSEKIDLGNFRYTGVEPSPFLLDRAKKLYSSDNKEFLLGDAYALPVTEEKFGSGFSVLVWHLLADITKAASEMGRVLVKDGRFVIITANPDSYPVWQSNYTDGKLVGKKFEGTMQLGAAKSHDVLYFHSFDEIKKSLQNAGLVIEKSETFLPSKKMSDVNLLISIHGRKN